MWLRHHLLYTKRGRRRQAPQALAPATGSGPRLSLQLTRLCDMRFPFVLAAVVSAAGFAACAPGVRVAATAPAPRAVVLDSAAMRPGRFDAGKMWPFDNQAIDTLGERLTAAARDSSVSVQIVSLYEGAQYSAYTYRRYGDVRLVLVPELGMGFFGGDDDNFTYPRYDLDFSVYRVYDASGKPLETPSYFRWSRAGTSDGDAVFVVGNPCSTSRLETVARLEHTRAGLARGPVRGRQGGGGPAGAPQGDRRARGGDRQQARRARAAARRRAVPGPEARAGRAGHARRGTVRGPDGRPGGRRPLVAHRAQRLGARARLVPGRPRGLGRRRVPVRAPGQPGGGTAAPGSGAPVGARRQPRRAARTGPVRRVRQDTPARRHVHAAARRRRGARLPVQRHAGGAG